VNYWGEMLVIRFLLVLCCAVVTQAAQIPLFFADSVVVIGHYQVHAPGRTPEWVPAASGFFYGVSVDKEKDPAKHVYQVYLVTNRHVLANQAQIVLRLNPVKATDLVKEASIELKDDKGNDTWTSHPNPVIDISVVHVNASWLKEQALQAAFFQDDQNAADRAKLKEIGVSIGDGIFVLGFPMGLYGTAQRNYVIARRGCIARISDALDEEASTFLIDAMVFPGNSGGPVVSAPSISAIEGTKAQDRAYLIGVVRAYLPYTDVAISQQTGQARMVLEENSGLAEVVPIDYVNQTIALSRAVEDQRVANSPKH
jgi:S1-C subfamily serine protease